jgi:LPXTG-motif cell wall-anchored protein
MALVLVGALAFAEPAGAAAVPAAYPPPVVGLQVSTTVPALGETIGVTGEGWAPGTTETISIESTPIVLATAVANSEGDFKASATIPVTETLGTHEIVATGPSEANPAVPLTLTAVITVVASTTAQPTAAAQPTSAPLPFTGWDTRAPLLASFGLILLGTGAVLVTRNRRHRRHA